MVSSSQPPSPTDEELLRQWHGGDKRMGSHLFHRHFTSIQRFFRNKVVSDDIEDLVQQTFLGCLESIESFRGDATFRTYLFAIARKRLYSYLRSRTRSQKRIDPDLSLTSVHDIGLTPSSVVAAAQEHITMLEALQRLSVERQTLLELFYWEELRGAQIAEILDLPPATVRTRLFRARAELKDTFDQLCTERGQRGESVDIEAFLRAAGATQ
jgi:RNA polymerase sigma-70 factor (ECF subfamily)